MKKGRKTAGAAKRAGKAKKAGVSFSKEFRRWLGSFRELKTAKALVVASFDAMAYLSVFLLSTLIAYVMSLFTKKIEALKPYMVESAPAEMMAAQLAGMQEAASALVIGILIVLAIYFAAIALCIALSRYLIWSTLLGKKLKWRQFWKFVLLNIILSVIIAAVLFLIVLPVSAMSSPNLIMVYSAVMFFLFAVAAAYFTYIMYFHFMETSLVLRSVKNAFVTGAKRLRLMWFPIVLVIGTFIISSLISLLSNIMPDVLSDIFVAVILLITFTWMKLYAVSVMKEHAGAQA